MNGIKDKKQFLTFRIGEVIYGIAISKVVEIIGMQQIALVPEMPSYIVGIINLRGKIVPVIDVRLRLGKEPRAYDDRTCIIIIHEGEHELGLIVDVVHEVINVNKPDEILDMAEEEVEEGGILAAIKQDEEIYLIVDSHQLIFD